MKDEIINNLKKELFKAENYSDIGKVLYENSLRCGNFKTLIPAIEEVQDFFEEVVNDIKIYLDLIKKNYKEKYGHEFEYDNDTFSTITVNPSFIMGSNFL